MYNVILTSTGFSNPKILEKVEEFFGKDLEVLAEKRVVIITTASEDKEKNVHALEAHSQLSVLGFGWVEFFDLEKRYARELLDYDLIYVSGGNTFYLLDWVKRSGFDEVVHEFLKKGGLYVGVSAGSLIAGVSIEVLNFIDMDENSVGLKDFSGMRLVDKVVMPHYTQEHEAGIRDYEKKTRLKVVRLADGMALIGESGRKFYLMDGK